MRVWWAAPLLVTLSFGAACSATSAPGPTDGSFVPDECKASRSAGDTASVAIGGGQSAYVDVADGDTMIWEPGPQGGHHIWVGVRMIGLRRSGTLTAVDVDALDVPAPDGGPTNLNRTRVAFAFAPEVAGHCVLYGLRLQIDGGGAPPLRELVGARVRITARLQDADGASAVSVREVWITGPVG